jgi:hypothetical protein
MAQIIINKPKSIIKDIKILNVSNDNGACYTCNPNGRIKKHIIGNSFCGHFIFHHDLNKRPVIILTPKQHLLNIEDFSSEMLKSMFMSIYVFCGYWNIKDYQVSYNTGKWKTHEHFHIKIKIPSEKALSLRNEHFNRIKKEEETLKLINKVSEEFPLTN